jgi:fructokinase
MDQVYRTVSVGELLWDILPDARHWGSAYGNLAKHCVSLDCEAWIVSAVGDDENGKSIVEESRSYGLNSMLPVTESPTGTVNVKLNEQRIPDYTIIENVAWDNVPFTDQMRQLAAGVAICFGLLAQRSQVIRQTIAQFLGHAKADILKLNDDELPIVASCLEMSTDQIEIARALVERYSLKWVVITRDEQGIALVSSDRVVECNGFPTAVVDTVEAGDAFAAGVAVGLLNGIDPERIIETVCRIASFVCSQSGAAPTLPDDLAGALITIMED